MFYSIIVPLYNRPDEIKELLESLTRQTYKNFEVLVIEDGSKDKAEEVVHQFKDRLQVHYFFKENSGQGFTRNYGFERARGDYFIIFDSDCIIPDNYLQNVEEHLQQNYLDAFGGPDAAHPSFTPVQKAINYSMTSLFTTGGIRGRKKHIGPYHPRSFNMGLSKAVYEKTKGFIITRMGEDIEFSIRIIQMGFKTGLIENAFVYHKRRTDFTRFFRQLQFFGRARINIATFFPGELKLVHYFPAIFTLGLTFSLLLSLLFPVVGVLYIVFNIIYAGAIFIDSFLQNKSPYVATLSIVAAYLQLVAYGVGFMKEYWKRVILGRGNNVTEYPS